MEPFPLLRLPRELRNRVYSFALRTDPVYDREGEAYLAPRDDAKGGLKLQFLSHRRRAFRELTRTNKQVREEAIQMFFLMHPITYNTTILRSEITKSSGELATFPNWMETTVNKYSAPARFTILLGHATTNELQSGQPIRQLVIDELVRTIRHAHAKDTVTWCISIRVVHDGQADMGLRECGLSFPCVEFKRLAVTASDETIKLVLADAKSAEIKRLEGRLGSFRRLTTGKTKKWEKAFDAYCEYLQLVGELMQAFMDEIEEGVA
ncbi:uncharacterized protein LTR77_007382 [Saxophila tyrrhenica]|uniref:Uncharacterized protein n=1 Tax=Saxophila tyrrhenica TaxID=1690608 RepID=A0AAV9P508_9PEZI|nr:hypothetical protein LTR77_007382 [Saxophila tyrrhenica]